MSWRLGAAWLLGCALLLPSCEAADPGAGSNTNWLRSCESDAECGDGLRCTCGVCSLTCDDDCALLPRAECAPLGSARLRAQCADAEAPAGGLCLPVCAESAACAPGQLCVDGGCVALLTDRASCPASAKLELAVASELQARYGTLFSDALYLPVQYAERPADWTEPAAPAPITARVTAEGEPVAGCEVVFVTSDGSGRAFPSAGRTDEAGKLEAYWAAGDAREQRLTAALVSAAGELRESETTGIAYANDEGPRSPEAEAVDVARPATLRLTYDFPDTADAARVAVSATSFPHHAFYAAIATDGFFAGLQNTSDIDALTNAVPPEDRVLIASVWNEDRGNAEQLFPLEAVEGLDCQPHDQDLGGIRCLLAGAWEVGQDYLLQLSRRAVATGETPEEYAELGYSTEPCAWADGCTDYTVSYGAVDDAVLSPVVVYRYASAGAASWFGSFVQPYADLVDQNSCLATPTYDATFLPTIAGADGFEPVFEASFSATYESFRNEVCANYDVSADASGFRLMTGGGRVLGRPDLPDEPPRSLTRR